MIKRYNNISLALGVPGVALQIAAHIWLQREAGSDHEPLLRILMLLGTVMLLLGLAYYAKAKGRHEAWCLFGLLSIIGIILLAALKDHAVERQLRPPTEDANRPFPSLPQESTAIDPAPQQQATERRP